MGVGINGTGNPYNNLYFSRSLSNNASDSSSLPKNNIAIPTNDFSDIRIRVEKRMGLRECETCKNRKYQDGSNDAAVSFKTPGHISLEASAGTVMAHEQEHVSNESAKAQAEGRKVVSQSVTLETSVCPECGRVYVSGGQTKTVTKADSKENSTDYFSNNYKKLISGYFGKNLDLKV